MNINQPIMDIGDLKEILVEALTEFSERTHLKVTSIELDTDVQRQNYGLKPLITIKNIEINLKMAI